MSTLTKTNPAKAGNPADILKDNENFGRLFVRFKH